MTGKVFDIDLKLDKLFIDCFNRYLLFSLSKIALCARVLFGVHSLRGFYGGEAARAHSAFHETYFRHKSFRYPKFDLTLYAVLA